MSWSILPNKQNTKKLSDLLTIILSEICGDEGGDVPGTVKVSAHVHVLQQAPGTIDLIPKLKVRG